MEPWVEQWQKWGRLVVESWDDEAIRQRIIDEPATVLSELGVEIPTGYTVAVVTDPAGVDERFDDNTLVLPLPPRPKGAGGPSAAELDEHELARMSGGVTGSAGIARALYTLPYGGYLGGTIVPLRVPRGWATIPTP